MMGVGCGSDGKLHITDEDDIEHPTSNSNRHFLFRENDTGCNKAKIAARAAKRFNSSLNSIPYTDRADDDTEHNIFTDDLLTGLSGVAYTLDNIDAHRYIDLRCVLHQLPLLHSGTMGLKGNIEVVYPRLTELYSSSSLSDPEDEVVFRLFPKF